MGLGERGEARPLYDGHPPGGARHRLADRPRLVLFKVVGALRSTAPAARGLPKTTGGDGPARIAPETMPPTACRHEAPKSSKVPNWSLGSGYD